jgi:hypothetical protein
MGVGEEQGCSARNGTVPARKSTYSDYRAAYVTYMLVLSSTNRKLTIPTVEILIKL